jgi:large subunit ribosomal protein L30
MAPKSEVTKTLLVVKIRGTVRAQRETRETLDLLRLGHTNHAILIDSRPAYKGMLQRVNSYVTYGEPSRELVATMIPKL